MDVVAPSHVETDVSNRISVQSEASEFSFQKGKEESIQYQHQQQHPPRMATSASLPTISSASGGGGAGHVANDRAASPTKSYGTDMERLVRRNGDLEKRLSEQTTLISSMSSHIEQLEQILRSNNIKFKALVDPRSRASSVSRHLAAADGDAGEASSTSETPVHAKTLESLQLPPRSAERLKTSPLKNDSSSDEPSQGQIQKQHVSEADEESSGAPSPTKDVNGYGAITPNGVSSPLESKTQVDWNATIAALRYSPEEDEEQHPSPVSRAPSGASTSVPNSASPYSGRIAHPSPTKVDSGATANGKVDRPPLRALETDRSDSTGTSTLAVNTPKSTTPLSPLRMPVQGSMRRNTVTSPGVVHGELLGENMSKTSTHSNNVYDSLGGDYQNGFQGHRVAHSHSYSTPQTPISTHSYPEKQITFPNDVPLFVEPTQLNTVRPEVISTVNGNPSKKTDDPMLVIAVLDRQTGKEMWRFKKTYSQLCQLDSTIQPMINAFSLAPLPEKTAFLTNIPSKVDLRRQALRDYLATLFLIPNMPLTAAYQIARFISLDVVNLLDESNIEALKEGWLIRRVKGIGNNWKARYCVVEGNSVQVLETPQGPLLEIIGIAGCQIGRQPDGKPGDDKSAYRHSFAIMDPKKSAKNPAKHIFCAETNDERDDWINVLVQVLLDDDQSLYSQESSFSRTPVEPVASQLNASLESPAKTTNSQGETDDEKELKKNKKRSFFPFHKKSISEDLSDRTQNMHIQTYQDVNIEDTLDEMNLGEVQKSIFKCELSHVFALSHQKIYDVEVPSVLYRCLQFLIYKSASSEEGIFRLSGSSLLIRQLRERFDKDYDIDLQSLDPVPDINTIAGLLKLWLRELPSNILTKELYQDFKETTVKRSPEDAARDFSQLVKKLPKVNHDVLYALFKFLNEVIRNKDLNKMNLKNLCIVFSPTLNVAGEILVPLLVDFKCVFEGGEPVSESERDILDLSIPTF